MTTEPTDSAEIAALELELKSTEDLSEDSLSFIYQAAELGIEIIEAGQISEKDLQNLLQIFNDVRKEVVKREQRTKRCPGPVLPCGECPRQFRPGTLAFQNCTCNCY